MIECEQFPEGSRLREICEGTADLPLEKINTYRSRWGLSSIGDADHTLRKMPALSKQAWNLASSLKSFASDGFRLVGKDDYHERLKLCDSCEHRQDARCLRCGCYVSIKAKVRADKCPEGKWPEVKQTVIQTAETSAITQTMVSPNNVGQFGKKKLRVGAYKRQGNIRVDRKGFPSGKHWSRSFRPAAGCPPFVTTEQLIADTLSLIPKLPADITMVAGSARSGLMPASLVAMMLHLPMIVVRNRQGNFVEAGHGWRLQEGAPKKPGRLLVIDDTCMTGNSMLRTKQLLKDRPGEKLWAAVYCNPAAVNQPDLWAVDLPWPHLLEWNLFNSVLLDSFALDFDGILCHDCPPGDDDDGPRYERFLRDVRPLYLVRKRPVVLIVTARLEKYRRHTEAWMNRWGIQAKRLVMGPWETVHERRRDDVAAWKARMLSSFLHRRNRISPKFYIESNPDQAQRIATLTSGLVVCPAAKRCFGKVP